MTSKAGSQILKLIGSLFQKPPPSPQTLLQNEHLCSGIFSFMIVKESSETRASPFAYRAAAKAARPQV